MSETTQQWLFGVIGVWCAGMSIAILHLIIQQVKTKVAVDLFIDTLGEKLARALHRDDDSLRIDGLLDKYLNRHYELSYEEWVELRDKCNAILANKQISKLERSLAGMLAGVCEHKLMVKYKEPISELSNR